MNEYDRIAAIAAELEAAASETEGRAVLQSGSEVVECARLAANRPALYHLAAVFLRASLEQEKPISAAPLFLPDSEYYLTDVVMEENPTVVPEVEETMGAKATNMALAMFLISIVVLSVVGAVSVIRWLF